MYSSFVLWMAIALGGADTAPTFVVVGLLGGFATFSFYALDALMLARSGHTGLALGNALGQMTVGVAAVWAGFVAGSWR